MVQPRDKFPDLTPMPEEIKRARRARLDRNAGDYLAICSRAEEAERKLASLRLLARREISRKNYTPERAKEMWGHALRICGPVSDSGILRAHGSPIEQK